jgi:hypothetical protein
MCGALAAVGATRPPKGRATLEELVATSPAIWNAGLTRQNLCFGGGRIDGTNPTRMGVPPQPTEIIDPAVCPRARRRAAAICLRGTEVRIKTPGAARRVSGFVEGAGHSHAFTAVAAGRARTAWKARLDVQGIVTSRRDAGELSITIDYRRAHSAWSAPLRVHEVSC